MRKIAIVLATLLAVSWTAAALAEEAITLQGKVSCAMCVMKEEGAKDCQNVLQVADGDGTVDYYLVKNEVAEEFGHACDGAKAVQVTGTVAEKDGKRWLTATKMVPVVKKA
ncbi:MAG TPA: DUF6370 family protein [Candidatus Polarisedimenticolaceae bacterium]|nr:DUF6370 family protein [Candidatus Polarisedimenticolaceae bacterium]